VLIAVAAKLLEAERLALAKALGALVVASTANRTREGDSDPAGLRI
jgi:hypothetical protein